MNSKLHLLALKVSNWQSIYDRESSDSVELIIKPTDNRRRAIIGAKFGNALPKRNNEDKHSYNKLDRSSTLTTTNIYCGTK